MNKFELLCKEYKVKIYPEYYGYHDDIHMIEFDHKWIVKFRFDGRQITIPYYTTQIFDTITVSDVLKCIITDILIFENCYDGFQIMEEYELTDPASGRAMWNMLNNMAPKVRKFLGKDFDTFADALNNLDQ